MSKKKTQKSIINPAMPEYQAKVLDNIKNKPNEWESLSVGVFKYDEQIGEYERPYPSLFNAFHPFRCNGKDLALYSADYTTTRIMELPSCKDIGGEDSDSFGFCPTDFYVPYHRKLIFVDLTEKYKTDHSTYLNGTDCFDSGYTKEAEDSSRYKLEEINFQNFGLIAGCYWGDDSSWKIQHLDLSKADKGKLKRTDKFGYIHLPEKRNLHEIVDHNCAEQFIGLEHTTYYDLKTGEDADN